LLLSCGNFEVTSAPIGHEKAVILCPELID